MSALVFQVDQEFKTRGIWSSKGRKNLILNSKDAAVKVKEHSDSLKLLFQHIDIEDGQSRMSFNIGKEGLVGVGLLKMEYDIINESFTISAKGTFSLEIDDSFTQQFKDEGSKLKFILMGVIANEGPYFGGFISRYEKFDRELNNYQDCPSVVTSIKM